MNFVYGIPSFQDRTYVWHVILYINRMTIIITSEMLIKEIQEKFNKAFPFLKIEFFIKTIQTSKDSIKKVSNLLPVGYAHQINQFKKITISPSTIVKNFELEVEKTFNMYVQLYRKSGNLWLEITITNNWTMKQQDETGNEISMFINKI